MKSADVDDDGNGYGNENAQSDILSSPSPAFLTFLTCTHLVILLARLDLSAVAHLRTVEG